LSWAEQQLFANKVTAGPCTIGNQQLHVDAFSFGYTGAIGVGLLWMRQRTGSLRLPVMRHNIVNILLVTL
jgi:hypothetical protein